jgi:hypothetical protein
MKNFFGVIAVICMVFVFLGCATKDKPATANQGGMPSWVIAAMNDKGENVIAGVGTAKLATINQSMTTSETRARTSIVRAMNSIVQFMMTDYTASSEVDTNAVLAFQEEITRTLARGQLQGAFIKEQNADQNGQWWCVVHYPLDSANNQIRSAARSAAALAPHAAAAFDAQERMKNAFDNISGQSWVTDN